ncbi:MAG: Gfo/Idh/MocA family oxidoreductase [Clostridia bacterium]|nr:Gfo/Idh/MocA family oxidoreductase [Clostridia bacterium]
MSKGKLRIGIIGLGRISPMHIVPAVNLPQSKLIAVCDIVKDRAEKVAQRYNCSYYTDYRQMLDTEKLDAVHICLPHYLHGTVSMYAFNKGVNVLCEKPMTIELKEAEKCVEEAKRLNVKYGIIFQCRYNNSSVLVKNALISGRLGKIISARSTLTWKRTEDYYAESDWKGTWDKEGGGVVIDQAIHSIDLVNWFIDSKAVKVSANIAKRSDKNILVEDTAEGLIAYNNGAKYGFYCMNNYAFDEPIEIRLFCENGRVVMSYDDAEIFYNDGTKESAATDIPQLEYEDCKDYWGFQHIRQIEDFYNSVLLDIKPQISGEDALKTQRIITAIYKSGKMGKEILL